MLKNSDGGLHPYPRQAMPILDTPIKPQGRLCPMPMAPGKSLRGKSLEDGAKLKRFLKRLEESRLEAGAPGSCDRGFLGRGKVPGGNLIQRNQRIGPAPQPQFLGAFELAKATGLGPEGGELILPRRAGPPQQRAGNAGSASHQKRRMPGAPHTRSAGCRERRLPAGIGC